MDNYVLKSFLDNCDVAIIGTNGGIGKALVAQISQQSCVRHIFSCSRTRHGVETDKISYIPMNVTDETSIISAVKEIKTKTKKIDLIIVATGILHQGDTLQPEKTWKNLDPENLLSIFRINTI